MDNPAQNLEALLVQVAQGDRAALRRLYDMTVPRLLGIALRMLGRRDLAEEAVQEAFIAIWSAAKRFDPARGKAEAWLATILRRKAIDRLRASPWLQRETEMVVACAVPPGDLHALAVRQCLDRLRDVQRNALMFVYYFGLTHEELGRRFDAPLGTVKSWIRRGLIEMRQCLEE